MQHSTATPATQRKNANKAHFEAIIKARLIVLMIENNGCMAIGMLMGSQSGSKTCRIACGIVDFIARLNVVAIDVKIYSEATVL